MSHDLTKDMPINADPGVSSLDIRVYYEDTDAGGVMYYANYLKFFERGRTEWLRRLGVDHSSVAAKDHRLFVVKKVEIQYRKPAKLDDLLHIRSTIVRLGRASILFAQQAFRGDELLCESDIQVCCVDATTFRPIELTQELRTLLQKAQN
ncbi:MAG TPA: tol-pal system-associated acyl-CoA thioesterase [Candidimonas sp.]|nr:tol-pal system-associated acyl-CoA thioesterase [Candidimonas sp.]